MKKILIMLAMCFAICNGFAQSSGGSDDGEVIPLEVGWDDPDCQKGSMWLLSQKTGKRIRIICKTIKM